MSVGFALPSLAKINLALEILAKRSDGYHELRTIYQTISLHDELHFQSSRKDISLHVEGPQPCPLKENLAYRAAVMLARRFTVDRGCRLKLVKRIPTGAGLGGGSSNAAVTLLGLCRLWDLDVTVEDLYPLAAKLGSDVPFFLIGGTGFGFGRGEQVIPLPATPCRWLVLIDPQVHISTSEAYAGLRRPLTSTIRAAKISRLCLLLSEGSWGINCGFNDFETLIYRRFPRIREAHRVLLEHGALAAQLSGSGSAVFGIFSDRNMARKALSKIEQHLWKAYLVKTVDQASYQRALNSNEPSVNPAHLGLSALH